MDVVTPTLYAVTLTDAATEYSQALPAKTFLVKVKTRTAVATRLAFVTGKVAASTDPYWTIPSGGELTIELPPQQSNITVFLANASAGSIVEILVFART